MVGEVVSEMDYLRAREQKLRDTNESTNNRVKWFGMGTTFLLIALWGWQIMYLRAYFRFVFLTWKRRIASAANVGYRQIQAPYLMGWAQPTMTTHNYHCPNHLITLIRLYGNDGWEAL